MSKVANVAACPSGRKCQRVAPEVPLKRDDGEGAHAHPDHTQRGFSSCEARIEKTKTRRHEKHHGGGDDDVRLVAGLEPLIQVDNGYIVKALAFVCTFALCDRCPVSPFRRST